MFGALGFFDYTIITIIILSLLIGFFKGLIETVLSLTRLILSLISATLFSQYTILFIENKIPSKDVAEYIAFIATFLITYLIVSIIKFYITSLFEPINKSSVDRMFGSAFGLVRGIVICSFIFIGILGITGALQVSHSNNIHQVRFEVKQELEPKWIQNSVLQPKLTEFSKVIISILPDSWWYKIESYIVTKKTHQEESFNDINSSLYESLAKNGVNKKKEITDMLKTLKNTNDPKAFQEFRDMLNNNEVNKFFSYDEFKHIMKIIDKLETQANEAK